MEHAALRVLADLAIFSLFILLPILFVFFTDRFRQPPSPEQYAVIFGLVFAAGVMLFLPTLSIVAATALLALGLAWFSGRTALSAVTYQRRLFPSRLFPDDEAQLTVSIRNDKLLPLAWITALDPIHFGMMTRIRDIEDALEFSGGIEVQETLSRALAIRSAIGPYQELRRTYRVKGVRRGVYRMGPVQLASGDPFGMFTKESERGSMDEIIVYPRIYTPEAIGIPFQEAMGSLVTRSPLAEDPTLLAGSREYRPDDPLRRIHWKATARTGDLQVRIHDPSTTAQLMIVLNLNTFQHVWQGVDLNRVEAVISAAASFAVWALQRGYAVGVRSNGIITGDEREEGIPRVPPSAHPQQTTVVLEHLARISFSGRYSAQEILAEESRELRAGRSMIFVTATLTPEIIDVLTARRLNGRVAVLYCGRTAAPLVRGLPVYLASWEAARAVS